MSQNERLRCSDSQKVRSCFYRLHEEISKPYVWFGPIFSFVYFDHLVCLGLISLIGISVRSRNFVIDLGNGVKTNAQSTLPAEL